MLKFKRTVSVNLKLVPPDWDGALTHASLEGTLEIVSGNFVSDEKLTASVNTALENLQADYRRNGKRPRIEHLADALSGMKQSLCSTWDVTVVTPGVTHLSQAPDGSAYVQHGGVN